MPRCPTCLDEREVSYCHRHRFGVCDCYITIPCPDCTACPEDDDDDLLATDGR